MATHQELMLETISMEYHAFRQDQVLTHKQLNDLISYFEDQDRLTRTCLIGVGLVCGLGISYNPANPSVTVGKGCAVTTDGDLLVMDTSIFKHFREYTNRRKGTNEPIYDPFFPVPDGNTQMKLWELVIPDAQGNLPADANPLNTFNTVTSTQLDDQVALLYLEYFLQDPDKCTAIDCDNQGPHQISKLRVLLLSKADMDKVINRDPQSEIIADSIYGKYNGTASQYFNLPTLKAKRVILNTVNTAGISALANSYTGIVQAEGAVLIDAIKKLYTAFGPVIDPSGKTNLNQLLQNFQQGLAVKPKVHQVQYFYDYYKDIIICYSELRDLLFRSFYECCPDKYAFPKHIMLGELKLSNTQPLPYRHEFYPSPIMADHKEKLGNCRSMWVRIQNLMLSFDVPAQPSAVKITPSSDYDRKLEDRALPFYYKGAADIVKTWNYKLSRRGVSTSVPGYHASLYAAGNDTVLNPLNYDIDQNNFFRIEGHLGKQLTEAMTAIDKIRYDKSIPFDLVAVRLNKSGKLSDINPDDFDCQFEDLSAVLKAWLVEQNCLYAAITKFFSGFTTQKNAGFHVRADDFKTSMPVTMMNVMPFVLMRSASFPQAEATAVTGPPAAIGIKEDVSLKPICKTIYTVDTTIADNLEKATGTLGVHFAEAVKQPAISADAMVAEIKYRTASDPNLETLTADEKEIAYEIPTILIANAYEISSLKPFRVNEISTDMLEKYILRMERLCAYVKKLRGRTETIFNNVNYTRRGYESYYLFLIQQLIANCCAAEKLQSLLEEIDRRKKKILDGLLFANYAKKHSGLEHKAGVHRGGTFVLVYAQELRTTTGQLILKDSTDLRTMEFEAVSTSVYKDLDSFSYYLVTNQGKIAFDEEVEKYRALHGIKPGSLAEQQFNRQLAAKIKEVCARLGREDDASVAANIVIADFCLPYLCCSDCPPMTFIMPKQQYNLALPKAAACNDEELLEFRKEPAAGTVKASAGFENTVTNNQDGRSFFNPKLVPEADFGKEISFTIDDQVTDCRITVLKHPKAEFTYTIKEENDAAIAVVFTNTSDDATGAAYVYEWNFSDGRQPQKVDDKNEITITYKKEFLDRLGLNGFIPVTLAAANGPCIDKFEAKVPYIKVVPVSLSLPKEVICNDAQPIPFTVQPADGQVTSPTEPGSVVKINEIQHFNPANVSTLGQVINFTVNGKATTCKIIVLPHPKASFTAQTGTSTAANVMSVTVTNTTQQQAGQTFKYVWKFSDGTTKTTTDLQPFKQSFNVDVLKNMGQTELTVTMETSNMACSDATEIKVQFPNPEPATCSDVVIENINQDLAIFASTQMKDYLQTLKANNPTIFQQVSPIVTEVVKFLEDARAAVATFNDSNVQASFLKKTASLLEKLYASQFTKDVNENVITPAVRALLRLAHNIVRCVKELSGTVKEILMNSIIEKFISLVPNISQKMGELNTDKVMNNFLDTWLNTTQLQDQQVKEYVKRLDEAIANNFMP